MCESDLILVKDIKFIHMIHIRCLNLKTILQITSTRTCEGSIYEPIQKIRLINTTQALGL